ncbi:MAG TPA: mechanosensitive ion channel family protein, partial [Bacteroidales bacterium]|nr:mechanosensitive ion channel family protein [Bacteroidales bacterium]
NIILRVLKIITRKTKTFWDDVLLERKVFNKLSHLVPALVVYMVAPAALENYPVWLKITQSGMGIFMLAILLMVINSFLTAILDIYQNYEISKVKSIKGYVQVARIIAYFIIVILIIAILIGKSPILLITGLGAFAAVLLLIFKDTILGLVGSIQLSANDMVRPGDWITMPSFGADGTVTDIGLTTVKVQNWDKTISTIPTYALVSNSFQNWRGMEESEGRRIKRSVRIDMNSVMFCTEEMLNEFRRIHLIRDYIDRKEQELKDYNNSLGIDQSVVVNGRRQTNLGVFRAYLENYLRNNPHIHQNMTFVVRHLESQENGIPMEIYVFSKVKEWESYERIQADVFDHVLASIGHFGLRVFQNPTGVDMRSIALSSKDDLPAEQSHRPDQL